MLEAIPPNLREDIKKNQHLLKIAIQNHQALYLKLKESIGNPEEIKKQLCGIHQQILSLGNDANVLVARLKKELAVKKNHNNNNSSITVNVTESNDKLLNGTSHGAEINDGKRKRENIVSKCVNKINEERGESSSFSHTAKKLKPISEKRPSTPSSISVHNEFSNSSDDYQPADDEGSSPSSEVSKQNFLQNLSLITKDTCKKLLEKNKERKRRRHAGTNSMYTNSWDLTVQRKNRTKAERELEKQQELENEVPPIIGSPPIIEIKKDYSSSESYCSSSPSPTNFKSCADEPSSSNSCIVCRKTGTLSNCDNCSALYHWACLDKHKICPQCQVGKINFENHCHIRSTSPVIKDNVLSKVLGDTSKPPTLVSSQEIIERYNRNSVSVDENHYNERLAYKEKLQSKNATMKMDLATLEAKATQLSESIVKQNTRIKSLSSNEELIKERIKKVVDFISILKRTEKKES